MNEHGAILLLALTCFFGCICIGFVLASASLPANNDDEIDTENKL